MVWRVGWFAPARVFRFDSHFDRSWSRQPGVGIFQAALTDNGLQLAQALHIGDSLLADVRGAEAFGRGAVWLVPGKHESLGSLIASRLRQP
ncbi:MAG: HAD hydrolase-like protein [Blastocatellia bacterium]|nr:HAD hydrolase-like protein [Blastocatellia bacterium]